MSTASRQLPMAAPEAECCPPLTEAGMSAEEASGTATLFKALSDPTRVQIVNLLATSPDEMCVCHINESFDLSQATLSHHLKKLVSAGILSREQRGTWAFYSLNSDALRRLSDVVRPWRRPHEPAPRGSQKQVRRGSPRRHRERHAG